VLSNHDVVRHPSRYALPAGTDLDAWLLGDGTEPEPDDERGLRRARAATLLMLALPGSAYLYQGEELGLPEVADLPAEALQDPIWERTGHAQKGRDGCRVPLPWTREGSSFGFGPAGSWLPQPERFGELSAEAQDGVEGSTLETYRAALRLRRELQADETLQWLDTRPVAQTHVLHFRRPGGWESVTNVSDADVALPEGEVLLASGPLGDGVLPPDTTVWLRGGSEHRGAGGSSSRPGAARRQWYAWTTACPRPRPISHRLTGVVTTKATANATASASQKNADDSPASIAPGTETITALSTSSITAIETVSAASATCSARRNGRPARSTPRMVSA
jgi:hypothetical protein